MPRKPKHPCAWPGCPELTYDTYCSKHKDRARRDYDKYQRSPDVRKQYGAAWQKIRNNYIQRHPLCEKCLAEGKATEAEQVNKIRA